MKVIPLGSEHSQAVDEIARDVYPPQFHWEDGALERALLSAEKDQVNLSFGLWGPRDQLFGYLIAWVANTRLERSEQVVLVDDLILLPEAEPHLRQLLKTLSEEIAQRELADYAIEAAVREHDAERLATHRRFLESIGYELVAEVAYEDDDLDETFIWVRYEPWSRSELPPEEEDAYLELTLPPDDQAEGAQEEPPGELEEEDGL